MTSAATMTPAGPGPAAPAKATRRDWIGLGVIALPCMVYAMAAVVAAACVLSARILRGSGRVVPHPH